MKAFAAALVASLVLFSSAKCEDDPIKAPVEKAKEAYVKEIQSYQAEVSAFLDKREEVARQDGNKKLLEQTKNERSAFEEKGTLPATAPAAIRGKPIAAKNALLMIYTVATKEYLKIKKDEEALALEKELYLIKRLGGKLPSTVIELDDRINKDVQILSKIVGKWLDGTSRGNVIFFYANGTCEEFLSTGKLNSSGTWELDGDNKFTAKLKNGYSFLGSLPEDDTFPVDVLEVKSGKITLKLTLQRAKKP